MNPSLKFLVVDALAGVQTFARQLLQYHGLAADHILCCGDPEAALAQGLAFQPQILISDWFPKTALSGPQLFQRLREAQPSLQLALLSFDVTPEQEREARTLGAHFLLKKPFTAEQLKAEVGRLFETLAKHPPRRPLVLPPQPVLKPGDRVRYQGSIHVAQNVVHRHGGTVVQLQGMTTFIPVEKLAPA